MILSICLIFLLSGESLDKRRQEERNQVEEEG